MFNSQLNTAVTNYHVNKLNHIDLDANKECIKFIDILVVKVSEISESVQKLSFFYENLIKDKVVQSVSENQKIDKDIHTACWDEIEILKTRQELTKQYQESYIRSCDIYLEAHRNHLIKNTQDTKDLMIVKKDAKKQSEESFKLLYVSLRVRVQTVVERIRFEN